MKIGHGSNSEIGGFRNLGIEGIPSFLIYCFYLLIPQSLKPSIPKSLNLKHNFKKFIHFCLAIVLKKGYV